MTDVATEFRYLSEEEADFHRGSWLPQQLRFFQDAERALTSDVCRRWAGRRTHAPRLSRSIPPDFMPFNRTLGLANVGAPKYHHLISNAIVDLTTIALTLRLFCASYALQCAELLAHWRAAWCLMLRRLGKATRPDVSLWLHQNLVCFWCRVATSGSCVTGVAIFYTFVFAPRSPICMMQIPTAASRQY